MAQVLETVTAQLRADSGQFEQGFKRAEKSVQIFQQRAQGAAIFGGRLQNVLANMAFQAAGVPGPLGKISESMLMFAGGSALVMGVVAGLGLIATAFNKMGEAAEKAEEVARNAAAMFIKHIGAIRGMGEDQRFGIIGRLATLRAELERLQDERVAQGFTIFDKTPAMVRAEHAIGELEAALVRLDASAATSQLPDYFRELDEAVRAAAAGLGTILNPLDDVFQRVEAGPPIPQGILDPDQILGPRLTDEELFEKGRKNLLKNMGDAEFHADLKNLGISAGRQFALGIAEGIEDMGDLLKRIGLTVLDFFITKGITSLFSGGAGAASTFAGVPNASVMPSIEPMGLSINTGAIPPPMTPFDVARDQWWQRALRESFLVARSQGFK